MGESNARRRRRSKRIKEQLFSNSRFGRCVIVLSDGIKPGDWLATRIRAQGGKCSERHANLLIEGKRKPNARAALAVMGEIIG